MKKLLITTAIVLGLSLTTFADPTGGGVFQRGAEEPDRTTSTLFPGLPAHGENTNQPAPLGTGVMVLTTLGAAYLVGKRRKEE